MNKMMIFIMLLSCSCVLKDAGEMWEYYPVTGPFELPIMVKISSAEYFLGDTIELFIRYMEDLNSDQNLEIDGGMVTINKPGEYFVKTIVGEQDKSVNVTLTELGEFKGFCNILINKREGGSFLTEFPNWVYRFYDNQVTVKCDRWNDSSMLNCTGCYEVERTGINTYKIEPDQKADAIILEGYCGVPFKRELRVMDLPPPVLETDHYSRPMAYQKIGNEKLMCRLEYITYCGGDTLRINKDTWLAPWEHELITSFSCQCNGIHFKRKLINL